MECRASGRAAPLRALAAGSARTGAAVRRLPRVVYVLVAAVLVRGAAAAALLAQPVRASLLAPDGARTQPHFDTNGFVDASAYVNLDEIGKNVQPLKLADLNGDQYLDVLGTRKNGDELVALYWNHDAYNFSTVQSVAASGVKHAVTADFNADGVTDVLVFFEGHASIFLAQRSNNSFAHGSNLPGYPGWSAVGHVAVFDRDGNLLPDIILAPPAATSGAAAANGSTTLTVYTNRQDDAGVFDKHTFTPDACTLSTGLPIAFADINGDCLPDLVLPCAASGSGGSGGVTLKVWYSAGEPSTDMLASRAASAAWTPAGDSRALQWIVFGDFDLSGTVSALALAAGRANASLLFIRNAHATGGYGQQCRAADSVELQDAREVSVTDADGGAFSLSASSELYTIDYNYDGRVDLLAVTNKRLRVLRNTLADGTLSFRAEPSSSSSSSSSGPFASLADVTVASAAAAYNTDQDGRQDVLLGSKAGVRLWYNNIDQERQFIVTAVMDSASFASDPRPFAASAGSSALVTYEGQSGKERHACSQCATAGSARSLESCQCTLGLNNMLNYVGEMAIGAGSAHRSYNNLLPNSFAALYPLAPGNAGDWKLEFYTQRNIGSIVGVIIVLACSVVLLGVVIIVLMWREHKEDKQQRYARDHIFSFSSL